jgi:hypothetical protein
LSGQLATHTQRNIEEFLGQKGFRRKIVVFQTGMFLAVNIAVGNQNQRVLL